MYEIFVKRFDEIFANEIPFQKDELLNIGKTNAIFRFVEEFVWSIDDNGNKEIMLHGLEFLDRGTNNWEPLCWIHVDDYVISLKSRAFEGETALNIFKLAELVKGIVLGETGEVYYIFNFGNTQSIDKGELKTEILMPKLRQMGIPTPKIEYYEYAVITIENLKKFSENSDINNTINKIVQLGNSKRGKNVVKTFEPEL
jgi:hypothetical protein